MSIIAVIHARGGSKRIPLKNICQVGDKPLIAWTILAARGSQLLDRVIVSTDHPDIKRISIEYGAEVPFIRPKEIAEDVASELVSQHAVHYLEEHENESIDVVVTMQPTTPFITPGDIDGSIRMLFQSGADAAVSVSSVHERPEWMFRINEYGYAAPCIPGDISGERGISQSLEQLYTPNGGIYVTRRDILMKNNSIFGEKTCFWIMPRERSIDIDEPIDLAFADFLARRLS